jgi:hypothetical protein
LCDDILLNHGSLVRYQGPALPPSLFQAYTITVYLRFCIRNSSKRNQFP